MGVKLGNGKWAIKEDKLLAYNDNSGRFFNKEFDFLRGSSATYVAKDGLIKTAGLQETNLVNNGDFSELGSELVTNGNFNTDSDWTKGTGWSISGGKAVGVNAIGNLQQSISVTSGSIYKVSFYVSDYVSGQVRLQTNQQNSIVVSANGTYVQYLTMTSDNLIIFNGIDSNPFNGSIDNISVKQVDPNDYWTLGTGWSIGDGVATCDGNGNLDQIMDITNGNRYKVSFTILNSTQGTLGAYLSGGFGGNFGNGTHAIEITGGSASSYDLRFVPISSFTGSITNISVQLIQTDTPRIDFSDSVKGALLLENQSTNLITYSEDLSQSFYSKSNLSVSADNLKAPDGSLSAYKIVESTASAKHQLFASIGSYTTMTISFFAKKAERSFITIEKSGWGSTVFNIDSGSVVSGTGSVQNFGNGWFRCIASYVASPAQSQFYIIINKDATTDNYTGDGVSGLYLWGLQAEALSFSTSYIPNHGVSGGVTRLADLCNNSGSAQDFNSEEGTLYAEISALADDGTNRIFGLSNNSNFNESIILRYSAVSNRISAQVRKSGSYEFTMNYDSIDAKTPLKVAFKYKQNDFSLWVNGFEIDTRSSGDIISELDTLSFSFVGGNNFYGKVRELQVFTEALTDEQLQKLTTI
jgi:hypothetical protein